MEEQVGIDGFCKGCPKRFEEVMGQALDKAHRVGEHDFKLLFKAHCNRFYIIAFLGNHVKSEKGVRVRLRKCYLYKILFLFNL